MFFSESRLFLFSCTSRQQIHSPVRSPSHPALIPSGWPVRLRWPVRFLLTRDARITQTTKVDFSFVFQKFCCFCFCSLTSSLALQDFAQFFEKKKNCHWLESHKSPRCLKNKLCTNKRQTYLNQAEKFQHIQRHVTSTMFNLHLCNFMLIMPCVLPIKINWMMAIKILMKASIRELSWPIPSSTLKRITTNQTMNSVSC